MGDRTFLIIILVMIFAGVYSYHKTVTEKGGVTPLSNLIDYAGLAVFENDKRESKKTLYETYNFDVKENFFRLSEKVGEIEIQRVNLLENRKDILEKLSMMNVATNEEALAYIDLINNEYKAILEQMERLEPIKGALNAMSKEANIGKRLGQLPAVRNELLKVLGSVVEDPRKEIPGLEMIFSNLEMLAKEEFNALPYSCDDMEGCLDQVFSYLQNQYSAHMHRNAVQPKIDIENLTGLANLLEHEYQFLLNNTEATENKLSESNREVENSFRELAQELVRTTEEDLRKVIAAYKAVEQEHVKYVQNLKLHQDHLAEQYRLVYAQIDEMMERLKRVTKIDFKNFIDSYEVKKSDREQLWQQLHSNMTDLNILHDARIYFQQEFVMKAAEKLGDDLETLGIGQALVKKKGRFQIEDLTEKVKFKQDQVEQKQRDHDRPSGAILQSVPEMALPNHTRLIENNYRESNQSNGQDNRESMQRLRDQDKDNKKSLDMLLNR